MLELVTIPCPLCGSHEKRRIGNPRKIDALFQRDAGADLSKVSIVACCSCSLIYVDPFPFFSDQLLEKMYSHDNNYFAAQTPKIEQALHVENPARRFRTAEKYVTRKIEKYLEIGCGQGYALQMAQSLGWEVHGQDVSPDFAREVKQRTGIDIHVGLLTEATFPAEYFDFIYVDSVLEHVTNPVAFMQSIVKFLAPGGVVYITLPNEDSLLNGLFDSILQFKGTTSRIMPFAEPYHVIGFSAQSVRYLGEVLHLSIPYLRRSFTHGAIERYQLPFSLVRVLRRLILGTLHELCDAFDAGMNMEVLFIKPEVAHELSRP